MAGTRTLRLVISDPFETVSINIEAFQQALQELAGDIQHGLVDVAVEYKNGAESFMYVRVLDSVNRRILLPCGFLINAMRNADFFFVRFKICRLEKSNFGKSDCCQSLWIQQIYIFLIISVRVPGLHLYGWRRNNYQQRNNRRRRNRPARPLHECGYFSCALKFVSIDAIHRHVHEFHGDRRFECTCNAIFDSLQSLNNHYATCMVHHLQIVWPFRVDICMYSQQNCYELYIYISI